MKNIYNVIFATDRKGLFGLDQKIPWNCKADMSFFRLKTERNVIVMGKNTFLSLNSEKGLKNRLNIIVSKTYQNQNVEIFNDIQSVFNYLEDNMTNREIYFIGGISIIQEIIDQYLSCITNIYHSVIDQEIPNENGLYLKIKLNMKDFNLTIEEKDGFNLHHYVKI